MDYFNNDKLNDRFPLPAAADATATDTSSVDNTAVDTAATTDTTDAAATDTTDTGSAVADTSDSATADAAAGGATTDATTDTTATTDTSAATTSTSTSTELTQEQKDKIFNDYLAEQGLGSIEDIKALKQKASEIPETEEQKEARIAEYNNSVTAFGISQKILSNSDISELETVKVLTDRDLAKKEFESEYRLANKDRKIEGTDEAEPVTPEEVDAAFEELYHLESTNAALQAKGAKMMKSIADGIRNATDSKFALAKEKYDAHLHSQTNIPLYNKFLKESIASAIPEKLTIFKDGETEVVFNLADESGKKRYDTEELEKLFVNDLVYNKFLADKDKTGLQAYIATVVKSSLHEVNRDAMNKLIFEQGKTVGTKAGSAVGAKAPFKAANGIPPVPTTDKVLTDGDKSNLKSQFQGGRR